MSARAVTKCKSHLSLVIAEDVTRELQENKDMVQLQQQYAALGYLAVNNPVQAKAIMNSHMQLNQHIEVICVLLTL